MNILMLLQSLLFYLIPLFWGRALLVFTHRKKRSLVHTSADLTRLPLYFGIGTTMVFGWALTCWYGFHSLIGMRFDHVFFLSVWVITALAVIVNFWQRPRHLLQLGQKIGLPLIGVLLVAALSYGVWTHNSAHPLNWDWYQHQTIARIIQEGQFSFFTSEVSDTFGFNSYPPVFHVLLAVAQYPSALTPGYVTTFWQFLTFWHVVCVGLVSLALGWMVTREKWVAGLLVLFGVLTYDSMISLTTFSLLPQTLAAGMGTGLLAALLFVDKRRHGWAGWGIVAVLGLPLIHYMVGGGMVILILALMVFQRLNRRWTLSVVVGLVLALMIGGVLVAPSFNLNFLNQGEAASFRLPLEVKQEGLERSYGYLAYLLIPLGLVYAWMEKRRQQHMGLAVFILIGCMLVMVADVPYVLKFFTIARYWVHLFMALGVWLLIRSIRYQITRVVAVLLISIALTALLIINASTWKAGLLYQGSYTHIASDDMRTAQLLYSLRGKDRVLVLSDPATQFVLEGLSGIDSIGGAYMKKGERERLYAGLQPGLAVQLVSLARTITDGIPGSIDKRYLVLSGRTFNWQTVEEADRWSFGYNTWAPLDISASDNRFINEVLAVPGVSLVYRSAYITVIAVN